MDFELDEPTMDSNYDDYYDASEGGEPPPAAPAEDSEGGPVVKVEDLEEHEVKEGDVEEHRVKRKHIIRSSWLQISHSFKQPSLSSLASPLWLTVSAKRGLGGSVVQRRQRGQRAQGAPSDPRGPRRPNWIVPACQQVGLHHCGISQRQ